MQAKSVIDILSVASSEEKIEALTDLICRAGDEPSAALVVLLSTLENSTYSKAPRKYRQASCLQSLCRAEPLRHGRSKIAVLEELLMYTTRMS